MRNFIRRWGLFRIAVIVVVTALTLWGVTQVNGFEQLIALLTLYTSTVIAILRINPPPPPPDPGFDPVGRISEWWGRLPLPIRCISGVFAIAVVGLALLTFVDQAIKGHRVPVHLAEPSSSVAAGAPFTLPASESPKGADYLYVRLTLMPVGKYGLCVAPAMIELQPVLDGKLRQIGAVITRSGEIARVGIGGQFDHVAVSVTIRTTQGCLVDTSIDDAYYQDRGVFP
jgi:hypothetical protein